MEGFRVYIGYEPRELDAYLVARRTAGTINSYPIILEDMRRQGLYERSHVVKDGRLWDVISNAPMATEFALTRFLTQKLAESHGCKWAMFIDCDMMFMVPPKFIMEHADPRYAVMVVKHDHQCSDGESKMDGQVQLSYPRKNWSSVMLINVRHKAWSRLSVGAINKERGIRLHQFCWLDDEEIGSLPSGWNHLVGVDAPNPDASLVHFTLGVPSMPGYGDCEYADEWRRQLRLSL